MTTEEILNQFPEVKWDRFVEGEGELIAYGWIDREQDCYKDFMVVTVHQSGYSFVTSSAKYSAKFSRRINSDHSDCKRVEDHFPDVVNVVRL